MNVAEYIEFISMLLIENNCYNNIKFADYVKKYYDVNKFNNRYMELLDKFLNKYALNKPEKSEENISS